MLSRTECIVAEIAYGIAINGSVKCVEVRMMLSVEFCMLILMFIVCEVLFENLVEWDRKYFKLNSSVCSKATAAMSVGFAARI